MQKIYIYILTAFHNNTVGSGITNIILSVFCLRDKVNE